MIDGYTIIQMSQFTRFFYGGNLYVKKTDEKGKDYIESESFIVPCGPAGMAKHVVYLEDALKIAGFKGINDTDKQ